MGIVMIVAAGRHSYADPNLEITTPILAILAADVAGYSRLIAADEAGTVARLRQLCQEVIEPKIRKV